MPETPEYLSDEQIAELAAKMRVADPTKDNGAFGSLSLTDALVWLRLLGVSGLSPSNVSSKEDAMQKLRHALWDSQRIDNIFHGKSFEAPVNLDIASLPSWPDWKKPRQELRSRSIGVMQMDGFKDAKRLDSYVFRHFHMSAFTQMENMQGTSLNAAKDITGAWIGAKATMSRASLDITTEAAKDVPFVTYFTKDKQDVGANMLLMEIIDVKVCAWPEPSSKLMSLIKTCQNTKFGHAESAPLVPMLQTPKFPLIIVRYSYHEGRPEGGSQFSLHLENQISKTMPGASARTVREKLQWHLSTGEEIPEPHLRMFARLLSFNADLVNPKYAVEMQSHWNGVSRDVVKETRISFFVPCLRLRWRALEEIETGVPIKLIGTSCNACGKETNKMMCGACKSVYYCNATCNKADWAAHKKVCKISNLLLEGGDTSSLPPNKWYLPLRWYVDFIPESGFAVEQESIKVCGASAIGDCPRNEYGAERFIVRMLMPPDYGDAPFTGQTVFVWDRRRSLLVRAGPADGVWAKKSAPFRAGAGMQLTDIPPIPFHRAGWERFCKLLLVKGIQRQLLYLWATRVGDCLEVDLEDVPKQTVMWN